MNEKYTYGYGLGWNVDNEYMNSLNAIMSEYINQSNKVDELGVRVGELEPLQYIEREDVVYTDDQMRQWYNQDYPSHNSSFAFEEYKTQILEELEKENQKRRQERRQRFEEEQKQRFIDIDRAKDELVANQFYLIDMKQDVKRSLHKKKNELELVLSEKKIQLSSILLEQQKTRPQYDENRNVLNSEELQNLRKKYDNMWLEVRKIEHALSSLNDCFKLMEFTQEESKLMLRSLNPRQRKIYEEIKGHNEPEKTPQPEIKKEVKQEPTLDGIVAKVCGDNEFTKRQSSKYRASKIKVFKKPEKANGFANKIVSVAKTFIGIIPRSAMKLYGQFLNKDTKNAFSEMEARAMELSDNEIKLLLREYNADSKTIPEGFDDVVKPRVNQYLSQRVDELNSNVNENLYNIAECQEIIANEESQELIDSAYLKANDSIKDLISLQVEIELLLKNSSLHSYESKLKNLNSKLNYAGGRFERSKDYDSSLLSRVSGLSQKIEYSLEPKEVVDSYTERENIYKENNKHKSFLSESQLEKLRQFKNKFKSKKESEPDHSKKAEEVRSLIESLKAMKAEITEQDVKEIEDLLKSR